MANKNVSEIKVVSANVNGFNNLKKRETIMTHLTSEFPDLIFLSDTRLDASSELLFRNEVDYHCYFNSLNSFSRGVCILVKKSFPLNIIGVEKSNDGNLICVKCDYDKKEIALISIYGPNSDSPSFFTNTFDIICNSNMAHTIIGGDYNVTLNHQLDNEGYLHVQNPNARLRLNNLIDNNDFFDPFRKLYGEKLEYTWYKWQSHNRQGSRRQHARLDYFLCSDSLSPYIKEIKKMPAVNSDHCPVVLSIDFDNFSKGKGLWKFDSKLLNEREFVDSTRKCIADTCAKYVIFPEYANFFQECTNDQLDLFRGKSPEELQSLNYNIDYNLLLEMLLNDIRNNTISYTIAKKRNDAKNEKDLLKDIVKLQLKSLEEETPDNLAALKEKEDLYLEIVTRKADRNIFFRSAKMKIQGEKPTSFFCKLEKCLATKKYVSNLIVEKNGAENEIRSQKDIEKELCNFYKNLYKCKDDKIEIENISDFLGNDASCNKLDQQAAESLEKEISSDELLAVLKKTNSSSAPGSTGFNYAFYKFFWRNLGGFITNAAKFSFESGNLPKSQRYGIITLLPKGKKDQRYLKNWRPLTMLNCIYKLISGTIANRINEKLHLIIHNEQSGFVRGRFIGEAIRSTYDTLEWAKKNKKKGLILLIDFFKAFDCINFKFIIKTLRYFGFKENIIKWISIILKDFSASVNHAGNISMIFDILSGCRQGDPLSPVIFIMAIEILCIKLRQDKKLKGFSIENLEMMLSLYADDCTIYLEYDGDNLRHCLKIMKDFLVVILTVKVNKYILLFAGDLVQDLPLDGSAGTFGSGTVHTL